MRQTDRAEVHFRLAQALERLEMFDEALDHYRKAVVLMPAEKRQHVCQDELSSDFNDLNRVRDVFRSIYLKDKSH